MDNVYSKNLKDEPHSFIQFTTYSKQKAKMWMLISVEITH